jgi:hypothetical protein
MSAYALVEAGQFSADGVGAHAALAAHPFAAEA